MPAGHLRRGQAQAQRVAGLSKAQPFTVTHIFLREVPPGSCSGKRLGTDDPQNEKACAIRFIVSARHGNARAGGAFKV